MKEPDKAIPEAIIVKREILFPMYNAAYYLARYAINTKNLGALRNFKRNVIELYLKIAVKFKKTEMKELKGYISGEGDPEPKKWIEFYASLREKVEKMGITEIEIQGEDLSTILKRP